MALVAAALSTTMMPRLRGGQASAIAAQLDYLRIAIENYRNNVRRYPHRLAELASPLVAGDQDACGTSVSAANRARWSGPYVARVIDGNFPAGDGIVRDTLVRNPATAGSVPLGQLQILVAEVDSAIARMLDRQFDGSDDFAGGTILWAATAGPLGTLRFQIPISGC